MTLMSRKERWQLFQRAITARARVLFGLLLSERRFRGKLLIDHKGKSLDLSVSLAFDETGDCSSQTNHYRSSLMRLASGMMAGRPKHSLVEKNRFPLPAFSCRCGRPWALLSVVSTNCGSSKFTLELY